MGAWYCNLCKLGLYYGFIALHVKPCGGIELRVTALDWSILLDQVAPDFPESIG